MSNTKPVWLAFVLVLVSLIVWHAVNVFLIAFAAILFAIFLHALGRGTQRFTKLPYSLALLLSLCVIIGLFTLFFWLYSPLIEKQGAILMQQLPEAIASTKKSLAPLLESTFFKNETFGISSEKLLAQMVAFFSLTLGSLVGVFIFLFVALYIAFDPHTYLRGAFDFVAKKTRKNFSDFLAKLHVSLQWWLLGRLIAMVMVGVLTSIGLWLLKVNLALILGLVAGLLTFIPYVGPIISAIPALLIAFAQSPLLAIYVLILYLVIHGVEGYMITPTLEQRTVYLPPALTILMQVLLGTLVGFMGLALATPLTVVLLASFRAMTTRRTAKPPAR